MLLVVSGPLVVAHAYLLPVMVTGHGADVFRSRLSCWFPAGSGREVSAPLPVMPSGRCLMVESRAIAGSATIATTAFLRGSWASGGVAGQRFSERAVLFPGVEETIGDFRQCGERRVDHEREHGAGMGLGQAHGCVIGVFSAGPFPDLLDVCEVGGIRFDGFSLTVGDDEEIPIRVLIGDCFPLGSAGTCEVAERCGHLRSSVGTFASGGRGARGAGAFLL